MQASMETRSSTGPVELREDVPLKGDAGGGGGCGWAGGGAGAAPRGLACVFAALAAGITVALLAQLRWGGGTLGAARHGAAAAGAAACSRAGTELLRTARGSAIDAAAAAALCLAVRAPHRTSLDASGSLVLWRYRRAPRDTPLLAEWGGAGGAGAAGASGTAGAAGAVGAAGAAGAVGAAGAAGAAAPRLVCAMWALRAHGSQASWHDVVQPAVELARDGFEVTDELAASVAAAGAAAPVWLASTALPEPPGLLRLPLLSNYLEQLQNFTSEEMSSLCGNSPYLVRVSPAAGGRAAGWRVWGAAGGAAALLRTLALTVLPTQTGLPEELDAVDAAIYRAALTLQEPVGADADVNVYGVSASGLAVIDPDDTYVALVTGLSKPFGSGADVSADGGAADVSTSYEWVRDTPHAPLDLAPAILAEEHICGSRYVAGAESSAALAQAGAALAAGGGGGGVERARLAGPARGEAGGRGAARLPPAPRPPRPPPLAAVNLVLQRGDALTSHADSRAGGLASRF